MSSNTPRRYTALLLLALAGCGMEAKIAERDRNKLILCEHITGNDTFIYNTNTVKATVGIGSESRIEVTDTEGWKRTLTESQASQWKCKDVK